jgi:hypothetical protein
VPGIGCQVAGVKPELARLAGRNGGTDNRIAARFHAVLAMEFWAAPPSVQIFGEVTRNWP